MKLSITMAFYFAECDYAVCHILFIIMLSVVMLCVIMLSVVAPSKLVSAKRSWAFTVSNCSLGKLCPEILFKISTKFPNNFVILLLQNCTKFNNSGVIAKFHYWTFRSSWEPNDYFEDKFCLSLELNAMVKNVAFFCKKKLF